MNKKIKVAICSPSFSSNKILRKEIKKQFSKVFFNNSGKILRDKKLYNFLKNKDVAIVGLEKINSQILNRLPNLKIISKFGVGLNNIDLNIIKKKKIKLSWTGGVNKRAVSEITLMFILNLLRSSYNLISSVKKGKWNKIPGNELTGKKIGVLGYGVIGKDLIELLKPFRCNIFVNDITKQKNHHRKKNLTYCSKGKIFKNCDVITIHLPLTKKTRNLIGLAQLKKMKKKAILINTSRGEIIKEKELYRFLLKNKSFRCAFDVFEKEPPENKKLLNLNNFICTPHIASNTDESILNAGRFSIKGLIKPNFIK